ncbi:MAG: IS110 family transposase [Alphaproteobacteria bacterium]|nr:IS110 family transposase [Alphaproteobacteria bacterium]
MNITTLGIDLAKNIFQITGMNKYGKVVLTKRLGREKITAFIAQQPPCLIGMEACGSSNYWARQFTRFGHEVRLMSPQYVKPYVKTNKNDFNDSQAICEAVTRPTMHFVPIKSIEQQDIQSLHRLRSRLVRNRTSITNQIRGLLLEYGVIIPQGIIYVRTRLVTILEDLQNELTSLMREILHELYDEFLAIDKSIRSFDDRIKCLCSESEVCRRLIKVPGIGHLTATALVAAVGDAKVFKNGRQMAAWLGIVPRQSSSGNKKLLLGISKRGDKYLRTLLIHGARAFVTRTKNQTEWLKELIERKGKHKSYVAVANKNARILWALIAKGESYSSVV